MVGAFDLEAFAMVDATGDAGVVQRQLRFPRQAMTNLLPVDQIAAVKDRHTGEVFERTGDEVVVPANPADAGVGMESGDDWVCESDEVLPV